MNTGMLTNLFLINFLLIISVIFTFTHSVSVSVYLDKFNVSKTSESYSTIFLFCQL